MTESKAKTPLIPRSSPNKLPDFKKSVKLKYVKLGYHYPITRGMYLFLSPLAFILAAQLSTLSLHDLHDIWNDLQYNLISVILCFSLLVLFSTVYFLTRPRHEDLLDFSCYKLEDSRKCTMKKFMDQSRLSGYFLCPSSCFLCYAGWEESLQDEDQVLHSRLQAGVRAFLHSCWGESCFG